MNPKALTGWRLPVAAALVVCGAPWSAALGEEPAPSDQGKVNIDFGYPIERTTADFTLALDAVFLTANSDLMGAEVAQVDDVLRSHLGLGEGKGLVVTSVSEDGPAAKAGIQKNDVLVTLGGEEVAGSEELRKSLEASGDKPIALSFIRSGKRQSVEVTPKSNQSRVIWSQTHQAVADSKYWLGLGLSGADETLRSQLALPSGEGLVVTSVENDSPAAKSGVMINDVLLKLEGKGLTTSEALSEQLQTIGDRSVLLELLRRGKPATLTATPEKHANAWKTVKLGGDGVHDVIFLTPQYTELTTFTNTLASNALNLTFTQGKPDLVQQVDGLTAQVKQLEAALAALRVALDPPPQPAQTGGEKKEEK